MTRNRKRKQDARRHMESTGVCYLQASRELDPSSPITGIPTPLPTLTKYTGGWAPGQLIVVASRPGEGKTLFATSSVLSALSEEKSVRYFSLEADGSEILERINPGLDGIPNSTLLRSQLTIDSRSPQTMDHIEISSLRALDADLVVVDYQQLIELPEGSSRREGFDEISRRLKKLALDLQVPVMVLAQLNRNADPAISTLHGSSALAMDADILILLEKDFEVGTVRATLAKNRAGISDRTVEAHMDQRFRKLVEFKRSKLSDNPILREWAEALFSGELTLSLLLAGWTVDGSGVTDAQREEARTEMLAFEERFQEAIYEDGMYFTDEPMLSVFESWAGRPIDGVAPGADEMTTVWELGEGGDSWFVEGARDEDDARRAIELWLKDTDRESTHQVDGFSFSQRNDWYWEPLDPSDVKGEAVLRMGAAPGEGSMAGFLVQG